MSVFGSIISAIFGAHSAEAASAATTPQAPPAADGNAPSASVSQTDRLAPSNVDVAAVLTAKAAQAGQPLDWQHSIVDLMKLLKLDSSLTARKELATELHYTGDMNDSAGMNMWLHSEVMRKISENGGNVSADLKG